MVGCALTRTDGNAGGSRTAPMRIIAARDPHGRVRTDPH
jgi:hypothetical protein